MSWPPDTHVVRVRAGRSPGAAAAACSTAPST